MPAKAGIQFLNSCWSLSMIYSGAGMTREQESKRARIEIICRGDPVWSPVLLKRTCISAHTLRNQLNIL